MIVSQRSGLCSAQIGNTIFGAFIFADSLEPFILPRGHAARHVTGPSV